MKSVMQTIKVTAFLSIFCFLLVGSGFAQVAPDATPMGPLATTSAEYKFPAMVDPDVLGDRPTELWAVVYRPADISVGTFPLLVFFHGNHGTCGHGMDPRIDDSAQYTTTGTCPPGYVVTPNHLGYTYLADRLASWGYIVVSINANRGITAGSGVPGDAGLNLARGRLLLKHLQRLSEWNTSGGTPPSLGVDLLGKLDFSSVGLMGHSRGGEGVRAAYNLYRDVGSPWPAQIPNPVTFQGIFEFAPVDGQTSRILDSDGTVWNVLLPMCDGDVSNLQGVKPFDRDLLYFMESPATQKSSYTVWGANHNFYNTEWQISDSGGCLDHMPLFPLTIGSPEQRQTGLASAMALFRGTVGPSFDSRFNQNFNPLYGLPDVVTSVTRVDRGYTDSPNQTITLRFEDFDQPVGTSTYGVPNDASGITIDHVSGVPPNHSAQQRSGVISWDASGPNVFFQTNWKAAGTGTDITSYRTLDFRVSRQDNPSLNPSGPTNFSIELGMDDGTLSMPVQLSSYLDVRGPVGGPGGRHAILQTARIPLQDFVGADFTRIRSVRLTFDGTGTGAIYVANIRLSTVGRSGGGSPAQWLPTDGLIAALSQGLQSAGVSAVVTHSQGNAIKAIRSTAAAVSLNGAPGVEIEVSSAQEFPIRNELAVLQIDGNQFILSRYPTGDTHTLVFTLTPQEYAQLASGEQVAVQYGRENPNEVWLFPSLDKSLLNK